MDNFIKSKINRIIELNLKIYDYYQSLITLEETKDKHPDYEKEKEYIIIHSRIITTRTRRI